MGRDPGLLNYPPPPPHRLINPPGFIGINPSGDPLAFKSHLCPRRVLFWGGRNPAVGLGSAFKTGGGGGVGGEEIRAKLCRRAGIVAVRVLM